MSKVSPQDLPRVDVRIGFLYVDKCTVSKKNNSLVLKREEGEIPVPLHQFNVLMLAPGVSITHSAISLMASSGVSAIWTGDGAGVWYANGAPLSRSNHLLLRQAEIVSDSSLREEAERRMYGIRFGTASPVLSAEGIEDLQRAEAREMKALYASLSRQHGVEWRGRDPYGSDPLNKTMTIGHSCLYAVCHGVIHALNLSTGLGIVHSGNYRAFTLDIADLYKHRTTIPAAFEMTSVPNFRGVRSSDIRARAREDMLNIVFLRKVVGDILDTLGMSRDSRTVSFADSNSWWSV